MTPLNLTLAFLFFEFLDLMLNKSTAFSDLIIGYIRRWIQTPIIFFLTQFNFIYLSFCIFYLNNHSFAIVSLYLLYFSDTVLKIVIASKVNQNKVDSELLKILNNDMKIKIHYRILFSICVSLVFFIGIS